MKPIVLTSAALVFFLLALAPPLLLLGSAFFVDGELSLAGFRNVLLDQRQVGLLWHSLVVGFLTTLFACLIGVPFGAALSRLHLPFGGALRFFFLIPVMLPTYVIGIAWTEHLPFYGLFGIVFILGLSYWPIIALFTEKGLHAVGRDVEDAARVSAPPGRVFRTVTLRLASPSILTGALFVFIFAVSDFSIPDLLSFTSTKTYQVFSSEIFYRWDKLGNSGEAAAASLPVILFCMAALFLILHLDGKGRRSTLSGGFLPHRPRRSPWGWPAVTLMVLVITASVIVPLATFFFWLRRAGGPAEMGRVVGNSLSAIGMDAFNSVASSVTAALLMVVVGFFLAYLIERSGGVTRMVLSFAVLLPLAFPALMIGVGEVRFWNHPWNPLSDLVYDKQPMLIVTYFARFIPIAVLSLRSSLQQVDQSMEEAALVSGRGFLYSLRRVLLPLTWRGLWAAFLLGYIMSMRELDTIAIIGAGNNTLPFRIYAQIHTSRDVIIAAHCVVLILTLLVPPLIYRLLVRGRVKII
jgi:iron(III) transport system permease protein